MEARLSRSWSDAFCEEEPIVTVKPEKRQQWILKDLNGVHPVVHVRCESDMSVRIVACLSTDHEDAPPIEEMLYLNQVHHMTSARLTGVREHVFELNDLWLVCSGAIPRHFKRLRLLVGVIEVRDGNVGGNVALARSRMIEVISARTFRNRRHKAERAERAFRLDLPSCFTPSPMLPDLQDWPNLYDFMIAEEDVAPVTPELAPSATLFSNPYGETVPLA